MSNILEEESEKLWWENCLMGNYEDENPNWVKFESEIGSTQSNIGISKCQKLEIEREFENVTSNYSNKIVVNKIFLYLTTTLSKYPVLRSGLL
jgi:hypothetical protein